LPDLVVEVALKLLLGDFSSQVEVAMVETATDRLVLIEFQ
jgi:hypothetical protein